MGGLVTIVKTYMKALTVTLCNVKRRANTPVYEISYLHAQIK